MKCSIMPHRGLEIVLWSHWVVTLSGQLVFMSLTAGRHTKIKPAMWGEYSACLGQRAPLWLTSAHVCCIITHNQCRYVSTDLPSLTSLGGNSRPAIVVSCGFHFILGCHTSHAQFLKSYWLAHHLVWFMLTKEPHLVLITIYQRFLIMRRTLCS